MSVAEDERESVRISDSEDESERESVVERDGLSDMVNEGSIDSESELEPVSVWDSDWDGS